MNIQQVKKIAKEKNVRVGNLNKKDEIIRAIQRAEGNFDCFGTAIGGVCDQYNCTWRKDCLNK
ncbi:MAG: SAP domain-containing protein [Nitrospirota bacterium]